ncbi:hypothetical protein ND436_002900 [Neisseria gonorrhoeae]|nr:hypothetical protein ND436_002900 [Neisseria gonorrhoeae]
MLRAVFKRSDEGGEYYGTAAYGSPDWGMEDITRGRICGRL